MAKSAVATRLVDFEPIDRLEEKVKMLVGMVDRLRAEHARSAEANATLTREIEAMRSRMSDAEDTAVELTTLREERDLIKSRVGDMLQQIESLNL
ncbi:MAG: cell division protein ZapB [Acidobacteria bacterium]|nr:cell division protein ZapB [Acidobacteriota bacterium]MBA3885502.1 cell division protein ZapB [Acidobacteriota bacterium]